MQKKNLIIIIILIATILFVTPLKLVNNILGFSLFTMLSFFIFISIDHILSNAISKLSELKGGYYNLIKWYSFSIIYNLLFVLFLKHNNVINPVSFSILVISLFFVLLLFGIIYVDYISSSNASSAKLMSQSIERNKKNFSKENLLNDAIDSVNKNLNDAKKLNRLILISFVVIISGWLIIPEQTPKVINSIFDCIINCMDLLFVKIIGIILFIIMAIPALLEAFSHFFRGRVNKKEVLDAMDLDKK